MTYPDRILWVMGRGGIGERDDAITDLVRRHTAFVYQIAYSILRDSHDAEDVTQDTFIRVMKKAHQLETICDQRAWLARIAWRLSLTRWTRNRRRRTIEVEMTKELGSLIPDGPSVAADLEEQDLIKLMERLTAELPEGFRHALVLSAIESMSAREVADILQIPEATVRTRVHRAKKLLRDRITQLMGKKDDA